MINRIIPLLLFIGFVWGQADLDKLVLKDGTTYFGEYSKIEGKKVFFKPQGAFAFQPVSVKLIKQLQLKDGQIIIVGGVSGVKARSQVVKFVFIAVVIYYIFKISAEQFGRERGSSGGTCGGGGCGALDLP